MDVDLTPVSEPATEPGLAPAPVLKALGEPVRWRIVERLAAEELCVCHLVEDLGLPQPLVSHHLKVLRRAGLVTSARHQRWTYYRLVPDRIREAANGLAALADHGGRGRRRPCS